MEGGGLRWWRARRGDVRPQGPGAERHQEDAVRRGDALSTEHAGGNAAAADAAAAARLHFFLHDFAPCSGLIS